MAPSTTTPASRGSGGAVTRWLGRRIVPDAIHYDLIMTGDAMPRGVVGFEVDLRCLLAAVDRGDAASVAGWFALGHGPFGQVVALA